eukprot:GSA25T00010656001.1
MRCFDEKGLTFADEDLAGVYESRCVICAIAIPEEVAAYARNGGSGSCAGLERRGARREDNNVGDSSTRGIQRTTGGSIVGNFHWSSFASSTRAGRDGAAG